MKLYDKYNTISKEKMGISYDKIIHDPQKQLNILLNSYGISQLIDINNSLANMTYDRIVHIINLFLSGELFLKNSQVAILIMKILLPYTSGNCLP